MSFGTSYEICFEILLIIMASRILRSFSGLNFNLWKMANVDVRERETGVLTEFACEVGCIELQGKLLVE
jgi:hypothetical protein